MANEQEGLRDLSCDLPMRVRGAGNFLADGDWQVLLEKGDCRRYPNDEKNDFMQ